MVITAIWNDIQSFCIHSHNLLHSHKLFQLTNTSHKGAQNTICTVKIISRHPQFAQHNNKYMPTTPSMYNINLSHKHVPVYPNTHKDVHTHTCQDSHSCSHPDHISPSRYTRLNVTSPLTSTNGKRWTLCYAQPYERL